LKAPVGVYPMRSYLWFPLLALLLSPSFLQASGECIPTPHRTTGTHYKPVTVQKVDVSQGIVVSGRVLAAPDCTPVPAAKVAHWQAGEQGKYVDRLRAYLFSDKNGHYRFQTEWPNLASPHIHFIVTAAGYETLETQWRGHARVNIIEFDIVLRKLSWD